MLAEKPSVARDIARVLGAGKKGEGYLHGNGYVVTWAIGHLVALAQPHEINPEWRQWRRDLLPMLPTEWPLVVYEKTKDQFEVVRKILNSPKVSSIVCATDAGREGELIFRYIYEAAGCYKPVSRLWISSLTPDAIRKGFDALRPGRDYDALADAARGRSRADWLVGMNLSRAYTLAYDGRSSRSGACRRPRSPCWWSANWPSALSCRKTISKWWPRFTLPARPRRTPIRAPGFASGRRKRICACPPDGEEAGRIVGRARTGSAAIESVEAQTQRMAPPAALRPDRTAAPRQPPVRLQRAEDAGHRPGALRAPQADQLSAHRQPAPLAGCGADAAAHRGRHRGALPRATGSRHGRASAGAPVRRRRQGHRPPRHHSHHHLAHGSVAHRGRAQNLRSDLPPPAERLARRPHLVGHHRDHRDP